MVSKVSRFIQVNNLVNNETIICATSGGVDSVCLIHILHKLGYKVVLAHVNHNIREQSKLEQQEMLKLSKTLNIPFELLDYHYNGVGNFHNDSHNARYNFFRSICDKYNTNIIATAHHLDDQIETVLIKIMEGSNLYGYGGISVCNYDGKYKIIRPLLCVNKQELYEYADKNNIIYFEDCSNDENNYLRNRIRHNIVPILKEECPDIHSKILQYSIQIKEAFEYIRHLSIEYLNKTNNIIEVNSFNLLDIAIKKDIISLLLEKHDIRRSNNIIISILELVSTKDGTKQISLEGKYLFIRNYEKGYIKVEENRKKSCVKISENDVVVFKEKYKFYFSKKIPSTNAKFIKLCYNDIVYPFYIRTKNVGDIIELNVGTKKVSRIFIDSKIPKDLRDDIPIIEDGNGDIIWIYNLVKSKKIYEQRETGDVFFVCEEISYDK